MTFNQHKRQDTRMQDTRRSYIDPTNGSFLFMEWAANHGWVPSMATMTGWQAGHIRIYSPRPDLLITMPGHNRWPSLTSAEHADIRALLEHPWIPDGQAFESVTEEQIDMVDNIQQMLVHDDEMLAHTEILDGILRPTLLMEMPLTLVVHPEHKVSPFPKHLAAAVLAKAESDGQTCAITLEPIRATESSITSCGHVFQTPAITEWMANHDTCPECRQPCCL